MSFAVWMPDDHFAATGWHAYQKIVVTAFWKIDGENKRTTGSPLTKLIKHWSKLRTVPDTAPELLTVEAKSAP